MFESPKATYLRKLGAAIPAGLTIRQTSKLIDTIKAKEQEPITVVKVPARVLQDRSGMKNRRALVF